tara:strand:+ start:700 stop:915 length:216 start_codon:yes stop_codon:yes gene_type:complete
MKYRIIPCIGKKLQYRIQVRKFFVWHTFWTAEDYGVGWSVDIHTFNSIDEAVAFAKDTFGNRAENVLFVVK